MAVGDPSRAIPAQKTPTVIPTSKRGRYHPYSQRAASTVSSSPPPPRPTASSSGLVSAPGSSAPLSPRKKAEQNYQNRQKAAHQALIDELVQLGYEPTLTREEAHTTAVDQIR
jgi:hypothetical protein